MIIIIIIIIIIGISIIPNAHYTLFWLQRIVIPRNLNFYTYLVRIHRKIKLCPKG
jgi:hypothetical protein